jgi:pterin-4a-carbinolamine dehydratase
MLSDKEAHMTDQITPDQFHEAEGVEDWRLTSEGATAFFRTRSFAESARFVQAISELQGVEEHRPGVDVRQHGVTVHMITSTGDYFGPSRRDVELARQISAAARKLELAADPSAVQSVLIIPGATNIARVMPFWRAVLGYEPRRDSPDEDLVDREWINIGLDKLKNMSLVVRKALLIHLTLIEAIHEQLQSRHQGIRATRKTARSASEPSQIMAQFGIITFYRIGVRFPLRNFVHAPVVPQTIIGLEGITVVTLRLWCFVYHLLDDLLRSLPDHFEAQIAAGEPIYDRDDEDFVFLSPMKVNNSSISASLTSAGTGGSDN